MSYGNEMSSWKKWRAKLKNTYRLVVMNNDTFEEVTSQNISLQNIYILISTAVVILATIIVSLIIFTPLKRYIPGYGSGNDGKLVFELTRQIEDLEGQLKTQRLYTENVRKILVGEEFQTDEDVKTQFSTQTIAPENIQPVERSKVDEELRQEIEIQEINNLAQIGGSTKNDVPLEQLYFNPPVKGEISAGFMPGRKHLGVDILAPKNTAVKAALDGYIFFSDWTVETGNTIGIQHENNIITFYKHNSALLKKVGSNVKAGEAVAIIGNTGTLSDGPHLHFELWYDGKPVDPTGYIAF